MSIPNKPTYAETLKIHALTWFTARPEESSLVSRTMSRFPVFFIALAAGIAELSQNAASFIHRSFSSERPTTETQARTQSAALQIFSMLWNIPETQAVQNAKLAHTVSSMPYFKSNATTTFSFNMGQLAGEKDISLPQKISSFDSLNKSFEKLNTILKTLPEAAHIQSLYKQDPERALKSIQEVLSAKKALLEAEIRQLQTQSSEEPAVREALALTQKKLTDLNFDFKAIKDHLDDMVFNIEHLTNPTSLNEEDLANLKSYLLVNHHTPCFNLSLIPCITDPEIKQNLKILFSEQAGSLEKIQRDVQNSHGAFKAFKVFCDKAGVTGLTFENIEAFKVVHGDLKYVAALRNQLKEFIISQVSQDIIRRDTSIDIPGYKIDSFNEEKKGFNPYLSTSEMNETAKRLMAQSYFDAVLAYNNSRTSDSIQALKDTLSMIFASTQVLEAEIHSKKILPFLRTSIPTSLASSMMKGESLTIDLRSGRTDKIKIYSDEDGVALKYDLLREVNVTKIRVDGNLESTFIPVTIEITIRKKGQDLVCEYSPRQIHYNQIRNQYF